MASNSLSLPIDIPWERICVSTDMIDPKVCDSDRPAKWQSSIAVFKYLPDDDYQNYPGRKITYIKVTCTIAGYQPKADEVEGVLTNWSSLSYAGAPYTQDELERRLLEYKPCHEAIVQVTVAPKPGTDVPLHEYPYIMDFQPKKRELYESVTDTKELMSRSLESLNVRKSSGTTDSQEVLDIDQGFNAGASGQYAGTGGSLQYGQQGQWGTKHIGGGESGLARTTDESHERRETTSHTTQLTQLHHLLDTYHQGTNRVVFYIQPRPNTVQPPSGFVRGLREVEGIQEFFLIVNQPKDQEDFCLEVRLDTGHLFEQPIMEYVYQTDTAALTFSNPTPVKEDTDLVADGDISVTVRDTSNPIYTYKADIPYHCFKRTRQNSTTYKPHDTEYIIDVANLGQQPNNTNGFHVLTPNTQVTGNATYTASTTPDGELLTISIEATSSACFKGDLSELSVSAPWIATDTVLAVIAASTLLGDPLGPIAATLLATDLGLRTSVIATAELVATGIDYNGALGAIKQQFSAADVELQVFLRSRNKIKDTGQIERTFFITTRGLCCCGERERPSLQEGIVYSHAIPNRWRARTPTQSPMGPTPPSVVATAGSATMSVLDEARMTIEEANSLRAVLREEMLQSLVSPRRTEPRSISQTDMLTSMVLPYIQQNPLGRVLLRQSAADIIPERLAEPLSSLFRKNAQAISRLDLLSVDTSALARATKLDEPAINQLKADLLGKPFKSPLDGKPGGAGDDDTTPKNSKRKRTRK
jgi:hypothetical protein